jgi:hypothetical protein
MGVHPDKTAIRAVEACGGTYTEAEYLSGFASAHDAAIGEAARAVAPCDALTAELLEALIASQCLDPLRMELEDCLDDEREALVAELQQIEAQISAAIARATLKGKSHD